MTGKRAGQARAAFAKVGVSAVPDLPDTEAAPAPAPRRPATAPAAADSVAFTVRFATEDALADDTFVLSLRRELHRRRLDKSEVVRALLTAAREVPEVRAALVASLQEHG
jgi:hypothetical protein